MRYKTETSAGFEYVTSFSSQRLDKIQIARHFFMQTADDDNYNNIYEEEEEIYLFGKDLSN